MTNRRTDLKALILGIVLGSCLVGSLAAAVSGGPTVGRFSMTTVEGHAYVLDTATGQVWEDFAPPTSGRTDDDFSAPKIKLPKAGTTGSK